jgi:HJR/Mrr/RecB family endonuclease
LRIHGFVANHDQLNFEQVSNHVSKGALLLVTHGFAFASTKKIPDHGMRLLSEKTR